MKKDVKKIHHVESPFEILGDFFTDIAKPIHFAVRRIAIVYGLLGAFGAMLFWQGMWALAGTVHDPFAPIAMTIGAMLLLGSGLLISVMLEE
jgi:hypothetical protein